tara:strand:- start:4097 stop:5929 length:1833 start_codon:yes stop_codon:yes gene_type:complete
MYERNSSPNSSLSPTERRGKEILKVIQNHRTEVDAEAKEWAKDLLAYRNKFWVGNKINQNDGPHGTTMQAPYLHSFTDVMVSNIVPPHPAVDIRTRRTAKKDAAKLRSFYVNDLMDKDNAVWKLRRAAALTSIMGRTAIKMVWSSKRSRPRCRVVPANRFYFDSSAEEWDDIRYAIEVVPMTQKEIMGLVKKSGSKKEGIYKSTLMDELKGEFKPLPTWVDDPTGKQEASRKGDNYIVVYEYYDFVEKKMYHMLDGRNEPIFTGDLPYPHLENPFYLVSLLDNLTDLGGLSHAQMIREPVSRLNELMTMAFEHTKLLAPTLFIHKNRIDNVDDFVTALSQKESVDEAILVETLRKYNIADVLEWSRTPQVPFDYSRMSDVLQELIEFTLALPTYSRGQVGNADVATELALVDTAQKTRNAPLQGVVNKTMAWMAQAYLAISSHYIDEEGVAEIWLKVGDGSTDVKASTQNLDLMSQDGAWDYDFKAFPYNAAEDNSTVRLKKFEAFQDLLLNSEHVDTRDTILEVLDALGMGHLAKDLAEIEKEQAAMAAAQAPPPGGEMDPAAMGLDPNAVASMPAEMAGAAGGEILAPGGEDLQLPLPMASGGSIPIA